LTDVLHLRVRTELANLHELQNIFNTKFANWLKKCQRLLTTFVGVCYFFIDETRL